jgi:taurine dioxygenase
MNVTALSADIGAVITGCDVRDFPDADREWLRSLLDRHLLLVFPGQRADTPAHIRFLSLFGQIADEHGDGRRHCVLSNKAAEGRNSSNAGLWHQDYSQTPFPLDVISLHATDLAGTVAGTRFVSTTRALRGMDAGLRARIAPLSALTISRLNGAPLDMDRESAYVRAAVDGRADRSVKVSAFPLVTSHPGTGESLLRANEMFTAGFQDVPYDQGRELLAELFEIVYDPAGVVEHHWRQGDLILWDNRALQHSRASPDRARGIGTRTLRRVTITDHMNDIFAYLPELAGGGIPRVRSLQPLETTPRRRQRM